MMLKEKNRKVLNLFPISRKTTTEKLTLNDLWNGDEIPFALKSSLAFIYGHHLQTVNLFRRNGNEIAHESLCNYLKSNRDTQPLLSLPMIYDVCSAIKAYVRDIPNGLMVKKYLKEWHKISRLSNPENIKKKCKSLIQKLPQANRNLLYHFLVLASAIIENQNHNAMSSKSLSIVLLPSFFEKVVILTDVKDLPYFLELLDILIVSAKFIIEPDLFESIKQSLNQIGKALVIQSPHNDDENLDDTKRAQCVSQDSGLNSTSFLDDKGSRSLSTSSQARATYQDDGNSMDDLLNESDCVNMTTLSDESDENRLHKAESLLSISSSISSVHESSLEFDKNDCRHRCHKQGLDNSFSCIGTQLHSLKECRPYSVYDSPNHGHNKWDCSEHNTHCYKPVYDRTAFNLQSKPKPYNEAETESQENFEDQREYSVQRRKPALKRSTCTIGPLERRSKSTLHSGSSTLTIKSPSITLAAFTNNDSNTTSINSSISSINSNISNTIIIPIKYKSRRNQNGIRNRFTAPIRPTIEEVPVMMPSYLHRTSSMNQTNDHIAIPDNELQEIDLSSSLQSIEETFI